MGVESAKIFNQSHKLISEESDRGAVIVAASILDDRLGRLLKSKLLPSVRKSDDQLFNGGNAPLGTFSAKIELAYRLKLINSSYYNLLNMFRKCRNECAHDIENFSIKSFSQRDRLTAIYQKVPEIYAAISSELSNIKDAEQFQRVEFDFMFAFLSAGITALEYGEFNDENLQAL